MCKARYIIDQAMQEYKKQTTKLKQVKDQFGQYTDVANTKK